MTEHRETDKQLIDRFERFTFAIFTLHHSWNRIATEEMKRHGMKGAYAIYLVTIANAEEPMTAAKKPWMSSAFRALTASSTRRVSST